MPRSPELSWVRFGAETGYRHNGRAAVLTCRPMSDSPGIKRPRPTFYWPVDAMCIAERLVLTGMDVARESDLPVPEEVRAEYVGNCEMLIGLKFEEALGLLRLASKGKTT